MNKEKILGIIEDLNNFMESAFVTKDLEILVIKANIFDRLIKRLKREVEKE